MTLHILSVNDEQLNVVLQALNKEANPIAKEVSIRFKRMAIFLCLIGWAFNATTPDECKVPVEEMSNFCKDLLYP